MPSLCCGYSFDCRHGGSVVPASFPPLHRSSCDSRQPSGLLLVLAATHTEQARVDVPVERKRFLRGLSGSSSCVPPRPQLWPVSSGSSAHLSAPLDQSDVRTPAGRVSPPQRRPRRSTEARRRTSRFIEVKVLADSQCCHHVRLPALRQWELNT